MPTTRTRRSRRRKRRDQASTEARRCGIYLRVSTEMQVDRNSLATQEAQLTSYAELHEWTVAKVFTDAGLSAKDTKRPALQQMLKWAAEGKLDVVLVAKVDRISRNLLDLLNLIDDLKSWGVDFVSASQSFDTSTPMGMLILNILGSFAQFEREMTGQRVRENMRERAKTGKWGGGVAPFGYRLNDETKFLEVEPDEAAIVQSIYAEFLRHRSLRRTISTMNAAGKFTRDGKPWVYASIRRILTSRTYVGTLCYAKRTRQGSRFVAQDEDDWVVAEDACEAIIDQDDFDAVQAELNDERRRCAWCERSIYLLTGLVRCGRCGGRMGGCTQRDHRDGSVYSYYRCRTRSKKGRAICEGTSCRRHELEDTVVKHIIGFDVETLRRELQAYKKQAAAELAPRAQRREELEATYARFQERDRRLLGLYEEALIDIETFRERRAQVEQERLAVAQEMADLETGAPEVALDDLDPDRIAKQFLELRATFPQLSLRDQQRLLQAMVREITVQPDGMVQIDFNLVAGVEEQDIPLDEYAEFELQPQTEPKTIGEQLKRYRAGEGMTQKDFAGVLGVCPGTLCQWELDRYMPSKASRATIEEKTGLKLLGNGNGKATKSKAKPG
jgi:site-specific DNA recombinase